MPSKFEICRFHDLNCPVFYAADNAKTAGNSLRRAHRERRGCDACPGIELLTAPGGDADEAALLKGGGEEGLGLVFAGQGVSEGTVDVLGVRNHDLLGKITPGDIEKGSSYHTST